jgi:hypothetical protein
MMHAKSAMHTRKRTLFPGRTFKIKFLEQKGVSTDKTGIKLESKKILTSKINITQNSTSKVEPTIHVSH